MKKFIIIIFKHFKYFREDLIIGGTSRNSNISFFLHDTDYIYVDEHATWCVQAMSAIPNWKNIFFTFSTYLWILVGIMFLSIALFVFIYTRMDNKKRDFFGALMSSIQIHIGFMPDYLPKSILFKAMFILFIFYGLIVSSLFQSASVSSMTGNYHLKQISSLKEAIAKGLRFSGSHVTHAVLSKQNDEV